MNRRQIIQILITCVLILSLPCLALAHPGKTDANGGHHDYNNVSGLGSYHYHHGYPAHLHTNGVCPYDYDDKTDHSSSSSTNSVTTYPRGQTIDPLDTYTPQASTTTPGLHNLSTGERVFVIIFLVAFGGNCLFIIAVWVMLGVESIKEKRKKHAAKRQALPQVSLPPPDPKPEPPKASPGFLNEIVYVNPKSGKYHRPGCEYFPRAPRKCTIEEAVQRNYQPCKVCRPLEAAVKKERNKPN